jgi:para-nitrobenzyl esterase
VGDQSRRADPEDSTSAGWLSGAWDDSVARFRGIPFAAPPVGPHRWRPPRPVDRWAGRRRAQAFGPAPVQPQPRRDSIMFHANFADRRSLTMSEDCLYLNVTTPDPSPAAGLPVMVWVHGGGNRYGYGSQDIHDAARLARRGVVVVTFNYRLGALGFLAHPGLSRESAEGASGNYGLMDVVAALQWVATSIRAFGGDPARVTAAGNSAGAALVCHLMGAPGAAGLFSRAIGQSSSGIYRAEGAMTTIYQAEAHGLACAASLGAPDVATLRRISGLEVSAAAGHFGPVLDGRVLSTDTQHVFAAGRQAAIPLLVGSNRDEGSVYARPGDAAEISALAGAAADPAFADVYPAGSQEDRRRSARMYVGDTRFVWPVWRWAVTHSATAAAPAWVYRFEREPPLPRDLELMPPPDGGGGYGVFHTAELPYMWDNLHTRPWPWEPADRQLAATMADAWVRFVESGDPNGGGLAPWPALTAGPQPAVMRFADAARPAAPYRSAAMRLLDARHQGS